MDQIVDKIIAYGEKTKVIIVAPVVRGRKGEYTKQLEGYRKSGYMRVQIDGIDYSLDQDDVILEKNVKHTIVFWSMEIAGEIPSILSTSGLSICPKNILA